MNDFRSVNNSTNNLLKNEFSKVLFILILFIGISPFNSYAQVNLRRGEILTGLELKVS